MKKLTATILIGMGLLMGGCGSNQQATQPTTQTQQAQTAQQDNGISLTKAIDLAQKGQFTPQRVQFEAYTTERVFGDEEHITVTTLFEKGEQRKFVKVLITDPKVIKSVAELQNKKQNKYVHVTYSITANEITFGEYDQIYVTEVE